MISRQAKWTKATLNTDQDEASVVGTVNSVSAKSSFDTALEMSKNKEAVLLSDNPGLCLALEGLYHEPVCVNTQEEMSLVEAANMDRSRDSQIKVTKCFSSKNNSVADEENDCIIVDPPGDRSRWADRRTKVSVHGSTHQSQTPKKVPMSYEVVQGVVDGKKTKYHILSKSYLNELWRTTRKYPKSDESLRADVEVKETLSLLMNALQDCDFAVEKPDREKACNLTVLAQDLCVVAQKGYHISQTNNYLARAGLIRNCLSNVLRAYGNNDGNRMGVHVHELIYLLKLNEEGV